jgi:hypothetical protein
MAAKSFHHVLATLGSDKQVRVLFADLTGDELKQQFIKPYERGKSFFAGHDLISPHELRSIKIIRTRRPDEAEREELNRRDRERIEEFNAAGPGLVLIGGAAGHEPGDIAEVGEDITHTVIKGPPGFRANRWQPAVVALSGVWGIVAAVVSAVVGAGLVFWLNWR